MSLCCCSYWPRICTKVTNPNDSILRDKKCPTCVSLQCLEAFAIGSVTCVQAAPNSITFLGPSCIISKNALTPTAALHCKTKTDLRSARCIRNNKRQYYLSQDHKQFWWKNAKQGTTTFILLAGTQYALGPLDKQTWVVTFLSTS